jgi:hypothetical protein
VLPALSPLSPTALLSAPCSLSSLTHCPSECSLLSLSSSASQVAFTAAGTARVSGAFHTCVERVLGVVAGVAAGYLTLSAQYSVTSALAGRTLNVALFAAWCFVCTLSRTTGPDW